MASFDYDVVIVGSGFGGSVAALRAAEKGYRVGVMESVHRWKDEDIPKTQWELPQFLWQCHGSRFDITTGAVINGPATQALKMYEVQESPPIPSSDRRSSGERACFSERGGHGPPSTPI